ncbi:MAG: tRNA (adenosine(37)-N6)-dimethylallyltransferase MiaA [Thermodesulfovibrionales bacterium]|nr:tRNA (adenosine(37)-N6)-dimethylallyltransferase MiaA [Thermodesulfovibrionales bacterium]
MKKVLVILGPTAVGKTAVSIKIAKELNTEIISSDSMQIYRYMDIGTAKPSLEDRFFVKHHLIDIVNPWEHFSTGDYIKIAREVISELHIKGKIPLLVGGTGLYLKAMTRGIFEGPSADWKLRERLIELERKRPGHLYKILQKIDSETANKISPSDLRRTIRALEVYLREKKPISEFHRHSTKPLNYEFIKIGLTRDRKELYQLINERVDNMMKKGLLEETKSLLSLISSQNKNNIETLPALQAIGYKELLSHLKGYLSLKEAINLIKKRTRNFAKRQFTWFKREENISWIDITGLYDTCEIAKKISSKLIL